MEKLTFDKLDELKNNVNFNNSNCIKVGMSTCGLAAGAGIVYETFKNEVSSRNIEIEVKPCGCVGMCFAEPLVEVNIPGMPSVLYGAVNKETALKILEEHVLNKKLVNDHIYSANLIEEN